MRILLVDDDQSIQLTLGAVLEDEGYLVVGAPTLEQARLELSGAPFDAILLDLNVGPQPGTELLADIGRLCPHARVVMLSGAPLAELPPGVHGSVLKGDRVEALLPLLMPA